jgi:hypothetical protein
MICVSPAGLMQSPDRTPFASRYWFSGERDGPKRSSHVSGSSIRKSSTKRAASFMPG